MYSCNFWRRRLQESFRGPRIPRKSQGHRTVLRCIINDYSLTYSHGAVLTVQVHRICRCVFSCAALSFVLDENTIKDHMAKLDPYFHCARVMHSVHP